jgi:hypothetical protein
MSQFRNICASSLITSDMEECCVKISSKSELCLSVRARLTEDIMRVGKRKETLTLTLGANQRKAKQRIRNSEKHLSETR